MFAERTVRSKNNDVVANQMYKYEPPCPPHSLEATTSEQALANLPDFAQLLPEVLNDFINQVRNFPRQDELSFSGRLRLFKGHLDQYYLVLATINQQLEQLLKTLRWRTLTLTAVEAIGLEKTHTIIADPSPIY